MKTTKQKLDELLGIADGQSVDDVLDEMTVDIDKAKDAMSSISEDVNDAAQQIDTQLQEVDQANPQKTMLAISSMDSSLKEIEDLIGMSKHMYKHVYENFIASDLIDSELLHGASSFLESIHVNIREFIQLYRDKQKFVEKVKLMMFQQQQKIDLMREKHRLTLELMSAKAKEKEAANAVDAEGSFAGTQEQFVKMLSKMSDTQLDAMLAQADVPEVDIPTDEDVIATAEKEEQQEAAAQEMQQAEESKKMISKGN